jgi:potassium efflux system protein
MKKCLLILLFLIVAVSAPGEPDPTPVVIAGRSSTEESLPSEQELRARLDGLSSSTDSDATALKTILEKSLGVLSELRLVEGEFDGLRQSLQEAPARQRAAEEVLASVRSTTSTLQIDGVTELEPAREKYALLSTQIQSLRADLKRVNEQIAAASARQLTLPQDLQQLRTAASAEAASAATASYTGEARWASERLGRLQSTLLRRRAELIEAQLSSSELRLKSLRSQQSSISSALSLLDDRFARLSALVQQLTKENTQAEVAAATEAAASVAPGLAAVIKENSDLLNRRMAADSSANVVRHLERALRQRREELDSLTARMTSLQRTIEQVGLNRTAGALLAREREQLPNRQSLRESIRARMGILPEIQLEALQSQEALQRAIESRQSLQLRLVSESKSQMGAAALDAEALAASTLKRREELLQELATDTSLHLKTIQELNEVEMSLDSRIREFSQYLEEHSLWVRHTSVSQWDRWTASFGKGGMQIWRTLIGAEKPSGKMAMERTEPLLPMAAVISGIALAGLIAMLLGRESVRKSSMKSIRNGLAIILSRAAVKGLLVYLAAMLVISGDGRFLVPGLMLKSLAETVFILSVLYQLFLPGGILATFAGWTDTTCHAMRKHTAWLFALVLILRPSGYLIGSLPESYRNDTSGVMLTVVAMLAVSWFSWCVFRRNGPLANRGRASSDHPPANHYVVVGRILLIPAPVVAVVLVLSGYTAVAFPLGNALYNSLILTLTFIALSDLAERRLRGTVFRRLLFTQSAPAPQAKDGDAERARRKALVSQIERLASDAESSVRGILLVIFCILINLSWARLLPALRWIRHIKVWDVAQADGLYKTITLGHIAGSLVTVVGALIVAKALPSLIDIALTTGTRVSHGTRLALTSILRYGVLIGGLIWACSLVGLEWSKVQWLVAALTVGIGFGLQEIVANFISGVILLFERPIRLGDIVTINGTTGTVTHIGPRATIVKDFERRELLIPNKELVTGQVVNWTLSEPVVRTSIDVGVAYGSDITQTMTILKEVAKCCPNSSNDQPVVIFRAFGESSLDFRVNVFLRSWDFYPSATTYMHTEIYRRLTEAGITIPFPQRDIHVVSPLPPLARAEEVPAATAAPL